MPQISEQFITEKGKALLRHKLREKINNWSYQILNTKRNQFLKDKGWDEKNEKEIAKIEVIRSLGIE